MGHPLVVIHHDNEVAKEITKQKEEETKQKQINYQEEIERGKRAKAEKERQEAELKKQEEENKKIELLRQRDKEKAELEIKKIEAERKQRELEEEIRRKKEEEALKRKKLELEMAWKKQKEKEEKERIEKNKNDINLFRKEQNIAFFLTLAERFLDDPVFLVETLEALNEERVITNYQDFKDKTGGKIQIIREAIKTDVLSQNCQTKLIMILLCNAKNEGNSDKIFENLIKINDSKKKLVFDILLNYSKAFGQDISFTLKEGKVYKEFVEYAIENDKYLESTDYRKNDIIQLKILNENREKIINTYDKIVFNKFNDYTNAYELVQDLIKYEKEKRKKFIFFPKSFWENYTIYYINTESENNKIDKLVKLYELLLSYIDLGKDNSNYKDILAEKINELIEKKIEDTAEVKEQLKLLFEVNPYYVYPSNKKNPKIFEKINILDLKEEGLKYFQEKDMENIYKTNFKNFLEVIIGKIKKIQDVITINKIIKLKEENNKHEYINLLIQKYNSFIENELTEEINEELKEDSFLNLFGKILEYYPEIKLKQLDDFLPKFGQKYQIYLKIFETFTKDEIKKEITILSIQNLELKVLIDLIKQFNKEQKADYFNNLEQDIVICEKDFFEYEISDNLKLLMELIQNKLIPESIYLDKSIDKLNTIYEKLSTFNETKSRFLETIVNEEEAIQKKFLERFEIFKLNKGDKFEPETEFNKIKDKYLEVKGNLEKAYEISILLSFYYKNTESYMVEIDKIRNIYKDYSNKDNKVNLWTNKEDEIIKYIRDNEEKAYLIKEIKEIELFKIIYNEFCEGDEINRFDKAKELLDGCRVIFEDIEKGNQDILDKWQNKFRKESGIDIELNNLKKYYKINDSEDIDKVAKNILIFTKKNVYDNDIKNILYFLKLFGVEETDLSKFLKESQSEFKDKENVSFKNLVKINNFLEDKNIYINDGKDDSSSIKIIRLFYNQEDKINFIKTKDVDNAQALLYKLNPTTDSLKFNDILEYQSCISFIHDMLEKESDENFLIKLKEKIEKDDIKKIIRTFKNYFINYGSIKSLDTNFGGYNDIYENIKKILNNSEFRIEFFKMEFKVYDDNGKEIDIIAKDLDGLIQIKDNINLNFELPDDNKMSEKNKKELKEKNERIGKYVKYVKQLQEIIRYFKRLENKGCPFLIDIIVKASKDEVTFELVNEPMKFNMLRFLLKDYCTKMIAFQSQFYKENEYFRLVYDRQLYRLFKRTTSREEDISSYVRFFTNSDSTNDEVPYFQSSFNDQSKAYKDYEKSIKENFVLISNYIEHIFEVNNTSLEKLYKDITVKNNLRGLYKCNVRKYNIDLFIIKMFLKLTDSFPIAQNILLTNNETTIGEIFSFMYRAMKCRFNTLFIVSISDDFSKTNLNKMTSLLDKIIRDMKAEKVIKEIKDLKPCILFITQNPQRMNDFPDAEELTENMKGDENKLEYILEKGSSTESKKTSQDEIYSAVRVYSSDFSGLGKSDLIKKEMKERGDDYHYFGVGDDITKNDLYIKLEQFLKREIRGKYHVGIHLDLFYTKNVPLMKYFLFAILITKLYQTNDNILYIPKNINIYVEIPNGPFQFLEDYPILTLFQRTNITLDIDSENKLPLDNYKQISTKDLMWDNKEIDKENNMTCIEKKIYLKTINYLSENAKDEYEEKIKKAAKSLTKCIYSDKLRKKDASQKNKDEKEKMNYILDFFEFVEKDAIKIQYDAPLIFKTNKGYIEIDLSDEEVKNKELKYFLSNLKKVMSLDESEEEIEKMIGDYKITEDNYKKMMLILFRIFANIPVILMGETGCGKTELIKQLMKMLNKDKENTNNNFIIKNMHSGVKEIEILEVISFAEENLKKSKNDMVCIFFDEINTTSLLSKMKEIFVNHSINGKTIDERIRFIGACNPFRANKNNEGDEGLKLDSSNDEEEVITYRVNPLPNSILNYVFYFKSLESHDIKKYIESIIGKEFPESENSLLLKIAAEIIYNKMEQDKNDEIKKELQKISGEEFPKEEKDVIKKKNLIETICIKYFDVDENKKKIESIIESQLPEIKNTILRKVAIKAIYDSHEYVQKKNGISSVSLRDLQRFRRAYKFFNEYYEYKNEFLLKNGKKLSDNIDIESKVKSFILSLFITYYIKLFKFGYKNKYLETINAHIIDLEKKLGIKDLSNSGKLSNEPFNVIIREEEEFLLREMEIQKEKGIGLNNSLKENIFLMFFSIYANIPLIVVGKPGCSKSLSIQLINRIMRGELSDSNFLKNYPTINSTNFQGSETNTPDSIENIFKVAEGKIDSPQTKELENLENIFNEIEQKILNQSNISDSLENIIKKTDEKLKQSNEFESLKNIYKETQEEMNKIVSNNPETIKKIFSEYEDKILNQSNDTEYIKYIYNKTKEKILSQLNTSENIKSIFKEVNNKLSKTKYLSLLVFDELGLSERSPTNCLKVLHSKL